MLTNLVQTFTPVFGYYIYIGGGFLTLVLIILVILFLLRRGSAFARQCQSALRTHREIVADSVPW